MGFMQGIFSGEGADEFAPAWRRVLKSALVAVIFGGLGCGAVYGLVQHRNAQAWTGENCIYRDELRLVGASWMTPQIVDEINSSLQQLPPKLSVMDPHTMSLVRQCLESNPWIKRVVRVRLDSTYARSPTRGLDVVVEFRRPAAFVHTGRQTDEAFVLIDGNGVRLGGSGFSRPVLGNRMLPVVTGVTSDAPPAGWQWDDPALIAGAAMADILGPEAAAMSLDLIDVSNVGSRIDPMRSEIVLRARSGTLIYWGSPASVKADVLEGTSEQKLARLRKAWRNPGFDRLAEIDLVENWQRRTNTPGSGSNSRAAALARQ